MTDIKRIDPDDCGCIDCASGFSTPLQFAETSDLLRLFKGELQNATSIPIDKLLDHIPPWRRQEIVDLAVKKLIKRLGKR